MNTARFIAQHLKVRNQRSFARTVSTMAVASIGVGVLVLLVAFAILGGFKAKIKDKILSMDAHYQLWNIPRADNVPVPLDLRSEFIGRLQQLPEVERVYPYANVVGILQFNSELQGISIKGVGEGFDTVTYKNHLTQGRFIRSSEEREIIISEALASFLTIQLGDTVLFNILESDKVRHRKLYVVGIYDTGLEDIDKKMVLGNIKMVQRVNKWSEHQVEGVDVMLKENDLIEPTFDRIFELMDIGMQLEVITQKYFSIFDWLEVINQNVNFLIVVVFVIVLFNMVAIMSILIMERVSMVGLLKALGGRNSLVTGVFWYIGLRLLLRGIVVGNLIAGAVFLAQYYLHVIPLDPANYYMEYVPVAWDWKIFGLINGLSLLVISAMIYLPTLYVARIRPIKSIKFD